eukprot:evm.model.scf_159.5 EVM.evm.TU.scf_159.5   scf_159:34821-35890(-)
MDFPQCSGHQHTGADTDEELTPLISFRAMQRARGTFEDFALSYFGYHDLKVPEDLFRFLDTLFFVEAAIYQVDEENEVLCKRGAVGDDTFKGETVLIAVLKKIGLLDKRIIEELSKKQGA